MFTKILCPVDFSDNSLKTLDQAVDLARKDDALLYVMNVEFVPTRHSAELADHVGLSTEPGRAKLKRIARERLADVRHELVARGGWPAKLNETAALIETAAEDLDVDLIVMATHGRTGVARRFLGSVAEHVVRESKRPVLTFGPGATIAALKKILCPVDFDANSLVALKFGSRLAQEYSAALTLLHVVPVPFEPSEIPVEPPILEWEGDARAQLKHLADKCLGTTAKCELVVERGDPAGAILDAARELRPNLIVMATHGRTGLSHLVLGSVAERTVRESVVPVLTVRGAGSINAFAATAQQQAK